MNFFEFDTSFISEKVEMPFEPNPQPRPKPQPQTKPKPKPPQMPIMHM